MPVVRAMSYPDNTGLCTTEGCSSTDPAWRLFDPEEKTHLHLCEAHMSAFAVECHDVLYKFDITKFDAKVAVEDYRRVIEALMEGIERGKRAINQAHTMVALIMLKDIVAEHMAQHEAGHTTCAETEVEETMEWPTTIDA